MTVVMTVVMTTLPLVTKLVVNGAGLQESGVPGQKGPVGLVGAGGRRAASVSSGDAAVAARSLIEKVSDELGREGGS